MNFVWYEQSHSSDLDADAVVHFARTLAARARHGFLMSALPIICEIESDAGRLTWRLGVTDSEHDQVLAGLRQALPDLRSELVDYHAARFDKVWELRSSSHRRAMATANPEQVAGAVLSALLQARSEERVLMQWLIGPWLTRHAVPPSSKPSTDNSVLDLGQLILDSEQTKALRDKLAEPIFGVVGRIAVAAATSGRRNALRQGVVGGLQLLRAPGVGLERRLLPHLMTTRRLVRYQQPMVAWPITLNASELAAVLCWPIGSPVLPGVEYSGHRHLPPSKAQLAPVSVQSSRRYRVTGESTFPGMPGRLTLGVDDGLRGLHVIGPTGTGKSNLLAQLVLQDIDAGRGVVVIDPKRDLVDEIANRIPKNRLADVVFIDPTSAAPVGINVLKGDQDDFIADLVVHVLRELYAANWGQRTADIIHNAVLSLVRHGGLTLCELPPLLTNASFRRLVTSRLRDDVLGVAPFWQWFESLSDAERSTVIAPVLNKLRSFTNRKAVRAVIGQAKGFDLKTVFTERKVVLINLATGDAGSETGQLLGSLILGALWATVQSRSQVAPERRHPVLLYVDEFADLLRLPQDLGDSLAKARGLGVGMVLAHQHLGQLSPTVKAAVAANARSRIVFQCGYDDAGALAKLLGGGLTSSDIQHLARFETYQALCHDGRTLSPASAITLPLGMPLGTLQQVRTFSQQNFGVPRAVTDQELITRRTVQAPASEVGTRRRRPS